MMLSAPSYSTTMMMMMMAMTMTMTMTMTNQSIHQSMRSFAF